MTEDNDHGMKSSSDFASGRQLFDSRTSGSRPVSAVSSCKSLPVPDREQAVTDFLDAKLGQWSAVRTKGRASIGMAEWLADRRVSRVVKCRGSYGFVENGVRFLTAYETITVIQSHEYEVTMNGLTLSQEEAISVCLTDERDFAVFRVYLSLVKQGMRVWPADPHVNKTGDVRSGEKPTPESVKRDLPAAAEPPADYSCPETKRRRRNSIPDSANASLPLVVSNLTMSQVRHREYIVPPIHEYLKANAKTWSEYKEINCYLDQNFVGRVVDLPNGLSMEVSKMLPSSVLSSGSTKCVNQFDRICSLTDLSKQLQDHGPQTYAPDVGTDFTTKVSLHFKTDEDEDGKVVVLNMNDPLPSPKMIHKLSQSCILIIAVIDESLISMFRFNSVTNWQALPTLWLKHVD